jgi:hypothetical protein
MRTLLNYVSTTLFVILLMATHVAAQGGGKAEPLRIEFARGTSGKTINDKIKDQQEAEYVLAAKKGQRLTIKLTSAPYRSSVFDIKAPGDADLGLEYDANYTFNKILPVTGDYFITVVRPTSAKGASSYKLIISIK